MESTKPKANFQPQIVQYKPAERSMLRNVPPFVRPSSNSFAFVRTNSSTNLNFASSAPTAPTPAAPFPHGDPCFVAAGRLSNARLSSRIRAETRSEEHTSELQSHSDLVCRLLLEKKNSTRYETKMQI